MSGFLIALFICLALAGSVMWVMPSPRDRRLAEMRQAALGKGIKVRLLDRKMADALFGWLPDYRGYCLYENYQLFASLRSDQIQVLRLNEGEEMHELDKLNVLRQAFFESALADEIPQSAEALIIYPKGLSLLWREQGGTEAVADVDAFLRKIAQQL
jgi:hypothetical protein